MNPDRDPAFSTAGFIRVGHPTSQFWDLHEPLRTFERIRRRDSLTKDKTHSGIGGCLAYLISGLHHSGPQFSYQYQFHYQ